MKITIDTKEDSHEEIKKIIGMLNSLVGVAEAANQGTGGPEAVTGEDMFSMFSDNKEEAPPADERMTNQEVSSMFSENREARVEIPEPKVVENVEDALGRYKDNEPRVVPY